MGFDWRVDGIIPTLDNRPSGDEGRRHAELVNDITKARKRFDPLTMYFDTVLKKQKPVMSDPYVESVNLIFTRRPRPEPDLGCGGVDLDIDFDPMALLEQPYDAKILGEFAISCWEGAIERLDDYPEFPRDLVREVMEDFRQDGYRLC